MKLQLEQRSTQAILGVLAILALLINWYFWSHSRIRWVTPGSNSAAYPDPPLARPAQATTSTAPTTANTSESDAAQVAAKAIEERRQLLARYLTAPERSAGTKRVALAVATADGKMDRSIATALATRFKTSGVDLDGSFFTPAFFSDGIFNQCFSDASIPVAKLELDKSLAGLVLGRVTTTYTSNPELQDVLTANLSVEVMGLPTTATQAGQSWTFTTAGAGFNQTAARAMAEERLLKQINADTKMSLNAVLNPN